MASTPQSRRSSQVSCTSSTKKQATSPRQEPEAAGEVPTVKPPEPRKKSNASVTSASSRTKTRRASGAPGPAASELHEDPPTVLTEVYYQYNKKRNLLIRPSPLDHTFAATLPSGAGVQEVAFKVGLSLGVCPFVSKVRPPLPVGFSRPLTGSGRNYWIVCQKAMGQSWILKFPTAMKTSDIPSASTSMS
jgi:hypothetical protein